MCRLIFLCLAVGVLPLRPQDIPSEKHHVLILENKQVRVYHLTLAPGQATRLHRHTDPYAYLTLQDARISNEAPGHKPDVQLMDKTPEQNALTINLKSGEVKWLSKGGIHTLSNTGDAACSFITFEFP